jgi:hypothetical protein
LLFATGKLAGAMMAAIGQSDLLQPALGFRFGRG